MYLFLQLSVFVWLIVCVFVCVCLCVCGSSTSFSSSLSWLLACSAVRELFKADNSTQRKGGEKRERKEESGRG